jgi:hypothetical protein
MEIPEIPFVVPLPSDWTFFGLTPKYKVFKQEQIFDLVHYSNGGFTYKDVYHMPVYLRTFYIKRLQKIFDNQKKEHDKAARKAKAAQSKSPKRPNVPRSRRR